MNCVRNLRYPPIHELVDQDDARRPTSKKAGSLHADGAAAATTPTEALACLPPPETVCGGTHPGICWVVTRTVTAYVVRSSTISEVDAGTVVVCSFDCMTPDDHAGAL